MTGDELELIWREIRVPEQSGRLEGRAFPGSNGIWVAVDNIRRPHLLVRVPDDTDAPAVATHGMSVGVARHDIAGFEPALYIDLVCLDANNWTTFGAVAADIGAAASDVPTEGRAAIVAEALARWQWFWDVDPDLLGEEDALGLFGELWFMTRWAGATASSVAAWTASDAARHDYQWPQNSIEVKTTASKAPGGATHRIVSLDQLDDPETGELFLFSLRVVRDHLAANTLPALVDMIAGELGGASIRHDFEQKVGRRGYSPAHRRRHEIPYRIVDEVLFRVAEGFPRLTRRTFPAGPPDGVADISYTLSTDACAGWVIARRPDEWIRPAPPPA